MRSDQTRDYRSMFRALVVRMTLVSTVPLLLLGGVNLYVFFHFNRSVVLEQHAASLRHHRESIEAFLENLKAEVAALAHQYTRDELVQELDRIFRIAQEQGRVLTDFGVIDSEGRHVRYVGPYDLAHRNYREAPWFRQVVEQGTYVSDMFLGFRNVPHFVIAVRRDEGDTFWILRATVNPDYFNKLVDATRLGLTGESFIVNAEGLYQTRPRSGEEVLERSDIEDLSYHTGIRVREQTVGDKRYLITSTWLSNPRWMLVFRQQVSDMYSPLWQATALGILIFVVGAAVATGFAAMLAHRQVQRIRKADEEREALNRHLIATGKAAAVGELSAGVAHEINNPLATIEALATWIRDLLSSKEWSEDDRREALESATKISEQVARCKTITQGLLRFSRRVEETPVEVDLVPLLEELATMAQTRARVDAVTLVNDVASVPPVFASPTALRQVFANLLNNALDATAGRPNGRVILRSRYELGKVKVEVEDNGPGIPPENLSKIFLPFFTTKPVGKGTGLGLAICYGIVHDLGGSIEVDSRVGEGSVFRVWLPVSVPGTQRTEAEREPDPSSRGGRRA